ncbi:MAG: ATP-dependent Clp protease proteolytic subunit [Chitinophagales bacterium]|nr:ATP-dependent Clp protease proteolytic subunit [Chitinophagales bacterium]
MMTNNITGAAVPMVIDANGRTERAYDIYSLLLKERIVFLGTGINDQIANLIVAQLLYLDSQNSSLPINMYINSPGGSVYAGLAIYDAMQMIKSPVHTFAVGATASMATVLLTSGEEGHRYALPHATVHLHPAGGGAKGYTEDVRIAYHEQERLEKQLFYIVGKNSRHSWQEIEADFKRDRFMNALEALDYGLIDEIMGDTGSVVNISLDTVKVVEGKNN